MSQTAKEHRQAVINEANELGIEFHKTIGTKKLEALIADFKGEPPPVEEKAPPSPAAKPDADDVLDEMEAQDEAAIEMSRTRRGQARDRFVAKRQRIAAAKARAFKQRIVTITNKDPRENEITTTAYVSFENQYFGLSKIVPLDIPVELEQALINILAATTMTLHRDEIVNGQRTGNKVPITVKKYAISYAHSVAA